MCNEHSCHALRPCVAANNAGNHPHPRISMTSMYSRHSCHTPDALCCCQQCRQPPSPLLLREACPTPTPTCVAAPPDQLLY
jgi:hypothetical protein